MRSKLISLWRAVPGQVLIALGVCLAVLAACASPSIVTQTTPNTTTGTDSAPDVGCFSCSIYTPQQMRAAYGLTALYTSGKRGAGQAVVLIESYGSPTLQQDLAVFDHQFGLPEVQLQVLSPLGTVPFDSNNSEMTGWQGETTLDVEMVHAMAPDAKIVVLTSPVDETEGVAGLPEFLKLEQYAVANHLGNIFSQSWAASEVSLTDAAGQAEIAQWEAFYQQAAQQDHITIFGSSGDSGATDYVSFVDGQLGPLSPTATTSFPDDSPWVTAVGGTTLTTSGGAFHEVVWNNGGASGGGVSKFFSTPSFQRSLPQSDQQILQGKRGVPDVAAAADPQTGLAIYIAGQWTLAGGTSAAAPLWAGVMAVANQVAGKPLGYINPSLYKIAASSQYSSAFRDITQGDNSYSDKGVTVQGYQATTGWDPTTGLGSPNAANLIPLLIQNSQS
ncbi:MAG TPA: S53 family peptidase [Ktedonobacterales bacterium]